MDLDQYFLFVFHKGPPTGVATGLRVQSHLSNAKQVVDQEKKQERVGSYVSQDIPPDARLDSSPYFQRKKERGLKKMTIKYPPTKYNTTQMVSRAMSTRWLLTRIRGTGIQYELIARRAYELK